MLISKDHGSEMNEIKFIVICELILSIKITVISLQN